MFRYFVNNIVFTNLLLNAILDSLKNRRETISQHCALVFDNFECILNFIFDSNYLFLNNSYYKQIFGTPMGSTISPILVNFVLDDLVSDCLQYMPFYVPFVKRYVDDLILALPKRGVDTALEIFNTYNRHIQFIVEEKKTTMFLSWICWSLELRITYLKILGIESPIFPIG